MVDFIKKLLLTTLAAAVAIVPVIIIAVLTGVYLGLTDNETSTDAVTGNLVFGVVSFIVYLATFGYQIKLIWFKKITIF